ncbi:MAG: leucyl/phenylalanyl-tRNA--protein transferase [Flavobacteriales bacterium]|nr:leucyl/phenylalanyl-tRNA--protein transferase [Flavobacteriales bacterium]
MSRTQRPPTIPVNALLSAYSKGFFPMCHDDGELYWHDPDPRAVFPLKGLAPNVRLQRALRKTDFRVTNDEAFEAVMRACADREETWIDERLISSFLGLHLAGYAHSVETWSGDDLVGGIYGVSLQGAFFGESMFSRRTNAGKAAFYGLVAHLQHRGHVLFDTQYINDFTAQLGALEISRVLFRDRLEAALQADVQF